jgi:hypothetical protein
MEAVREAVREAMREAVREAVRAVDTAFASCCSVLSVSVLGALV